MKKYSLAPARLHSRLCFAVLFCLTGTLMALAAFGYNMQILAFGGSDINLITGTEMAPRITQSNSVVWAHGNTVVVAYNDSSGGGLSPRSYCGVSTSTDGGNSYTRLPYKFNAGGTCYGSPSLFYSVRAGKFFISNLSDRCNTLGVAQWTSPDGVNWTNGTCAHNGQNDDFPHGWVDNNPASPFYGRQYYVYNNFSVNGGAIQLVFSSDDGTTWSAPITVSSTFRRVVKITGSLGTDGTIFIQAMDEGGGGLNGPRQNFIFRSTNGGSTWSSAIAQGSTFLGPGRATCGSNAYFACMYSTPLYWRQLGWGQPGVGPNGVVHYAYAGRPSATGDPGNILYVRSTDNGLTWSPPIQLNTDTTTRAQWGASLAVNASGRVVVSWYDERNTTNNSLQRFARISNDNGASWGTDMELSDVIFPTPLQRDPNIHADYAGYYEHAAFSNSGTGDVAFHSWTDGRVLINGDPQQDVFIDRISVAPNIMITNVGSQLVSAGPNMLLDPGETVTVALGLRNTGTPGLCTTAALAGTLLATNGVTNPTPTSQNYGVICGGDPPVFRNFTFRVDPALACGATVTASLAITDGTTSYGTATYPFITGSTASSVVQDFDGVTAPALPAGWVATNATGAAPLWVTSTTSSDTAPNNAFVDDPATASDKRLDSATIAMPSGLSQLVFRNNYNLESTYDGGVLEVSSPNINGGAFTDITNAAVGGSFVGGGYNGSINPAALSPIAGRSAWTGNSNGYIDTVANMGPNVAGQSIKIRFRMGSDSSIAGTGWRIDSLALRRSVCAPAAQSALSRKTHDVTLYDVPLPLAGSVGIEPRRGSSATGDAHTVLITFPASVSVGSYSVASSNGLATAAGTVSGNVVTVNLGAVANAQTLTLNLLNVSDGINTGDVALRIGMLLGDTSGNGTVNATDIGQTKSQSGQAVTGSNFRTDVNVNGAINASDIGLVKSVSGTQLPTISPDPVPAPEIVAEK